MSESQDVEVTAQVRVAVVGVGGAGNNVVTDMYDSLAPVHTIAVNTDKNALHLNTRADEKIYICKEVLKGEGTRGDASLGKKCAEIHEEELRKALSKYDYVFVVAGLGGGTGSGAAPVIINIAESLNCTVVAVMIKPFSLFEMSRVPVATESLRKIKAVCKNVTVVENDKLFDVKPDVSVNQAFRIMNKSIERFIFRSVDGLNTHTVNLYVNKKDEDDGHSVNVEDVPINAFMKA